MVASSSTTLRWVTRLTRQPPTTATAYQDLQEQWVGARLELRASRLQDLHRLRVPPLRPQHQPQQAPPPGMPPPSRRDARPGAACCVPQAPRVGLCHAQGVVGGGVVGIGIDGALQEMQGVRVQGVALGFDDVDARADCKGCHTLEQQRPGKQGCMLGGCGLVE